MLKLIVSGGLAYVGDVDDFIEIGRYAGNSLVLDCKSVSRHHASVFFDGYGWVIRDEESSNGTRVNGENLPPEGERTLRDGDEVRFGLVSVHVVLEEEASLRLEDGKLVDV